MRAPPALSRRELALGLPVAFWLTVPSGVRADVPAVARAAYVAGRWVEAAGLAGDSKDPDQLAFAARALLAGALLNNKEPSRAAQIGRARGFAEAAIKLNSRHIEGRLQLATALGLQARLISPPRALARGMPQAIRRILDGVTRDAPREAWAWALLGGWHLEALRIGGVAAQTLVGADLKKGREAFARAMALDGNEPAVPFYFGAALMALTPPTHARDARTILARAAPIAADDAFHAEVKARAARLADTFDAQGATPAARLALSWL